MSDAESDFRALGDVDRQSRPTKPATFRDRSFTAAKFSRSWRRVTLSLTKCTARLSKFSIPHLIRLQPGSLGYSLAQSQDPAELVLVVCTIMHVILLSPSERASPCGLR